MRYVRTISTGGEPKNERKILYYNWSIGIFCCRNNPCDKKQKNKK